SPNPFTAAKVWIGLSVLIAVIGVLTSLGLFTTPSSAPPSSVAAQAPLERPAFVPAGRPHRVAASHPSVVPHFVPGRAGLAPDPSTLLLQTP
ncbi:MAG: hypothetical protein AAF449_10505, partial [Myxococcota bacterium]